MKRNRLTLTILLCLIICCIANIAACGKEYKVSYDDKEDYIDAKDAYPAGTKVIVYYDWKNIGTDTDYSFFLDGERLNCMYVEGKGYEIVFTMPERDVSITHEQSSSMMTIELE